MEERIFFGGTAYLSIPRNESFRQLFLEGVTKYGINYGASRNNPTVPEIYKMAEDTASLRTGAGASIIVSSGYLAAQLVLQELLGTRRLIYAPDTHPALWSTVPAPPAISFSEWVAATVADLHRTSDPVMIISNSFNNLVPEIYSFEWLRSLPSGRDVVLLIDDSHGIGVLGRNGSGSYEGMPEVPGIKMIMIASMAKALGVDAGLICADSEIIDSLRKSPVYAGASPASPGFMYAYYHAEKIYQDQLQLLRWNMDYFMERVYDIPGLQFTRDFPVVLSLHADAGELLRAKGFEISFFPYPDASGLPLNRIVLSSSHTKEDLDSLADALRELPV